MLKAGVVTVALRCLLIIIIGVVEVMSYSSMDINNSQHRRQRREEGCILPPFPEHGEWKLLNGEAKPGDKISQNDVIQFQCHSGYKSTKSLHYVCNREWIPSEFPKCEKLCLPLNSTTTLQLKCLNEAGEEIKCNEATSGTHLRYKCSPFYETPVGYKETIRCEDGNWNYPLPVCQPVCGRKTINDATLVISPSTTKKLEYPWVTAIYRKERDSYTYICGGTILSPTIVLTAAHCVTDEYGDVLQKSDYLVGAGKLNSQYQAPEDKEAQYRELSDIIVHQSYAGDRRRYIGNIAILVTKEELVLNQVVQPICFDKLDTINVDAGAVGELTGWVPMEDKPTSTVLQTQKMPYINEETCSKELPSGFADKYLLVDKICAGIINQTSVCYHQGGSGLVFKNPNDGRYYIHAMLTLSPRPIGSGFCTKHIALYTKMAFYYEYIERLLAKYPPETKNIN